MVVRSDLEKAKAMEICGMLGYAKRLGIMAVSVLMLLCLAACSLPESNDALLELNENCEFGGVLLGMTQEQMVEKIGTPDAENLGLSGTECSYHTLDISAVVDEAGTVRRLSSKSADVSVFGITVGSAVDEAAFTLADRGYTADAAGSYRYNKDEVQLILLTIDGESVLGFTLEWLE